MTKFQFLYISPLFLVIFSNIFYHLTSKACPKELNPFISLSVTYLTSLIISLILAFLTVTKPVSYEISKINFTSILLGLAIIGVEGGYLFLYRNGWDISKGSLIANVCTAVILLLIGIFLFKEHISLPIISGIVLCITGIFLITLGN